LAMQLREKRAQRGPIEVRRLQRGRFDPVRGGNVGEELRQFAFVGAYGMRRGVAVKSQKAQKCSELFDHRSTAGGLRARALRAPASAAVCRAVDAPAAA